MSHWSDMTRRTFVKALAILAAGLAVSRLGLTRVLASDPQTTSDPFRAGGFDPDALYLTWIDDPCTTMTIQWHTVQAETRGKSLYYQKTAPGTDTSGPAPSGSVTSGQTKASATSKPLPGTTRDVQTVSLTGLEPGTQYQFFFNPGGPVYKFKTLPAKLDRPVRFIVAGDVYKVLAKLQTAFEQGAKTDPDFAVLAGDIAYDNGRLDLITRCIELLAMWKRVMVRSDGCLVPIFALMGNHELPEWKEAPQPPEKAQAFYALYALPGAKAYRCVNAGDYLSLFLLDSDHTNAIDGDQLAWLKSQMTARAATPHKIPIYHVPAFPSSRNNSKVNKRVLKHWVPVFEEHGVGIAFEHHDHTFKRTFSIKNEKLADDGIVYFGDGGWAMAQPRIPRNPPGQGNWINPVDTRWYLQRTGSVNHFHLCEITPESREVRSINLQGVAFDISRQDVKTRKMSILTTRDMIPTDEPAAKNTD
jgi:acid phosphatase type 7